MNRQQENKKKNIREDIGVSPRMKKSSFNACLATSKDNILLTLSQLQNYEKLF